MLTRCVGAVARDLAFGVRLLRSDLRTTCVVVVTLAVAIGANTAILSIANAVLFKSLPYPDADGLVSIVIDRGPGTAEPQGVMAAIRSSRAFEGTAAMAEDGFNLVVGDQVRRVQGARVTPSLFTVLKLAPAAGRVLADGDAIAGAEPAVMISSRLWRATFQGSHAIVGTTIGVDGVARRIVGVTGEGLDIPEFADIFLPASEAALAGSGELVARLRSGIEPSAARAEAAALVEQSARGRASVSVLRLADARRAEFGPIIPLLAGAVALVLFVACANVSGIQIARTMSREPEFGVRRALGASRRQLAQQLTTETLLLALGGGAAGVLLASWAVDVITAAIPVPLPVWLHFHIDMRVLALTALVTVAAGALCAIAPAMHIARVYLNDALKSGGRSGAAGRTTWRSTLVMAEVAVTVVLLVAAGLLVRTIGHITAMDLGAGTAGARTMEAALPASRYATPASRADIVARLLDVVGHRDGSALAIASEGPASFTIDGGAPAAARVRIRAVTGDYFRTMGLRMLRGGSFGPRDVAVAAVSEEFARRMWPGGDPIGRTIAFGGRAEPSMVIGVVGDTVEPGIYASGIEVRPVAAIYVPYASSPGLELTMVVRGNADADAASFAADVERRLHALDAHVAVYNHRRLADAITLPLWPVIAVGRAIGLVALIAILLAAAGVYGVTAQVVAQRSREMGIRTALGATSSDLLGLVIFQTARPAVYGSAIGLVLSLAIAPLLSSLVYGVRPLDAITYAGVVLLVALTTLIGTYLPARGVLRVDPATALRQA